MPRYIVNESDDDYEPKTAPTRKTRAAVAAATVTDSPIRRSTRNRQSPVNPDGSSPESITGTLPTLSTRITRRRVAAAAANTLPVSEPARALRSRKNSVSSNVSENPENESTPGTPRTRAIKRLSIVELSPGPLKPGSKIRGNTRASSESKSPPPVVRTTRRTRASSIDPEPSVERATRGSAAALAHSTPISTPTRKRRQQVSVHPTEPALAEEENDDKIHESSKIDVVDKVPEEEIEDEIIFDKTSLESSRRSSSSSSGKKSPKNKSLKKHTDVEDEVDENLTEESTEKLSTTEILSIKDKFQIEEQEEAELLKTPEGQERVEVVSAANIEAKNSPKSVEILAIKTKRHSLDKSKELGMKIEDLLNKSTEEQEKSPGNKENEKLNVSPEKVKKNLEFTVSIVDIAKTKSLSSTRFLNKSNEKKINILDKQVLSEPRFDIAAAISAEIRGNKSVNTSKDSHDLNVEKKSQSESPNVVKSMKKNRNEEAIETESGGDHSSSKTSYTKINETSVENEVIEELTLDDSESEFSLAVEDDVENEKKTIDQSSNKRSSLNKSEKKESNENSDGGSESDSNSDIFVLSNVSKNSSRRNSINDVESKKQDTPKRRISLKSKKAEELLEVSKSDDKQDKKRQSIEKIENEETEVTKKDFVIENDSKKDINEEEAMDTNEHEEEAMDTNKHEEEAMDTNEHEEAETNDNCNTVSAEKNSLDKKEEHLKEDKESKGESKNEVLESDSEIAINNLFQNISAEEWNKKKKNDSPKVIESKRKSSLKGRRQMSTETNSDDDLVLASEKSWKKEDSDSGDTLILKKNDSPKKINKNKKPGAKPTLEAGDNEDEEMEVTVDGKKSPNKSVRSNTSMKNESNDQIEGEDNKKNSGITIQEEEEKPQIDDDISDAETIPSNIDKITPLKSSENIEEEKEPVSLKNTSKNSINKTKKKSSDVYRFEDSFEDEDSNDESANENTDNEENTEFLNSISKLESRKRLNLSDKKSRTPLDRNYSTVVVADSESDNATRGMPGYLFSVGSSDDEDYNAEEEEDQSKCSMDSDIAKEMNLAGDNDLEYSDDNVTADDCHASESEHSDEDDAGSDIDGFIIADDEVESSEYSEEEPSPKGKFKRILDKSSSEEEDNNEETDEKLKNNSLCKTPDDQDSQSSKNESAIKLTKLQRKQLNFSIESDKTFSDRKIKKGINVPEISVSPSVEKVEKKEDKNVKKIYKPLRSLMNTTVDLCTPETNPKTQITDKNVRQSPGLNSSLSKKLRKNLVVDLGTSTPEESNEMHEDEEEEEESVFIPQTKTPNKDKKTPNKEKKTPNKEKKTPKSTSKNQRDSMQLIEDTALLKSNISDLNKSMVTPNSESPVTKFLKKERLNESLPLLELKKRASKTFETKTLNKMSEDEQEEDDADETDEQEKAAEESGDEESDANDNSEEKGDEINARGHQDDDEEDETDKEEDNEDLDKQNDLELEDEESEEPSDEEETKKRKKEKRKSASKIVKTPEIKGIEKSRKSGGRKSKSKSEEDEQEADDAVETAKQKEATKESEEEESDTNDILEEKADEINANGYQDDDDDEEEDNEDLHDENDRKPEDEESEESSDEELEDKRKKEKSKSSGKSVKTPEIKGVEKSRKSGGRKSTSELEKDIITKDGTDITPNKDLIKRRSRTSTSSVVNGKSADSNEESISRTKKRHLSTPGTELPTRKKRARLESSETPLGPKDRQKVKAYAVLEDNETEDENDEAPESLGFGQARTEAFKEMKEVASSLKAAKEAKKKKRRDQLERIRVEKEAKISKKLSQEVKTSPKSVNTNLKRLPDELLENLSDLPQRPKKKRKISKKEEKIVPSRFMFSPGESSDNKSLKIEDYVAPVSTGGGTTHFSVVNLEKVKKQPKKAAAVASFRDIMLARNPRQPVSAFLMYKAKQKASGKQLSSRKQA